MGRDTKIQWTGSSWTPIRARLKSNPKKTGWHCEKVSLGCGRAETGCYAEAFNRARGTGLWFKPGNRELIEIYLDEKFLRWPFTWPAQMIFPCSMTDAFGEFVKDHWLDRMFAVMALTPQHTYQILTKRPERMLAYLSASGAAARISIEAQQISGKAVAHGLPLKNVWLGVSVEDQASADSRIPLLLQTQAALHWLSYEPGIGLADFRRWLPGGDRHPEIGWIVVGGASGRKAPSFSTTWADLTILAGAEANVPIFVKQLGAKPIHDGKLLSLKHTKGGDIDEWPERLKVRQFPEPRRAASTAPQG